MADRIIDNTPDEVPELPEMLEKVLLFTLEEAKEKLGNGADVVPFTALVVKDNLFLESHPGDNAEECFNYARHTVQGARGADAYAFCYDGYIDTDEGMKDALIAEGGIPGAETGYAVGYLYEVSPEGEVVFESEPAYIGEAPNFMENLKESSQYAAEEIDVKYTEDDDAEADAAYTEDDDADIEETEDGGNE